MRPQRMCPTTCLGTYVIKKLKLYDKCCDQLLLSGEPNSAYVEILSTGGLKNRSMRTMLRGTVVWSKSCFTPGKVDSERENLAWLIPSYCALSGKVALNNGLGP